MIVFVSKRAEEQTEWRTVKPGDEIPFCPCFDRWPADVERPSLGPWTSELDYERCIAAVTAQRKADSVLHYREPFADPSEVRALVLPGLALALASPATVVLVAVAGDPYLALQDVLEYMAQLQGGTVQTFVATDSGAWSGPVSLDALSFNVASIGWPQNSP